MVKHKKVCAEMNTGRNKRNNPIRADLGPLWIEIIRVAHRLATLTKGFRDREKSKSEKEKP